MEGSRLIVPPPPRHVYTLIPGTCDYDLIWEKKDLGRYN